MTGDPPRGNLLFIPHTDAEVPTRTEYLARALTDRAAVHLLLPSHGREGVLARGLHSLRAESGWMRPDGIIEHRVPHLEFPLPGRKFHAARGLRRLIRRQKIDAVISASFFQFPVPKLRGVVYLYDLVDDHGSHLAGDSRWTRRWLAPFAQSFIEGELGKADRLITVSHPLARALNRQYGKIVHVIPNGVDLALYRKNSLEHTRSLLQTIPPLAPPVFGMVGNHREPFAGLSFGLELIRAYRAEHGCGSLLVVGPIPDDIRIGPEESYIVTAGNRPREEIPGWYSTMDVGLVPFIPDRFTRLSFPLKTVEMRAAGLPVIICSGVGEGLEESGLTRLRRLEYGDLQSWVTTMYASVDRATASPPPEISDSLDRFDWRSLSGQLLELVESTLAEKGRTTA